MPQYLFVWKSINQFKRICWLLATKCNDLKATVWVRKALPSYCQKTWNRQCILQLPCLLQSVPITDHSLKQNYWSDPAQMFLHYIEKKKNKMRLPVLFVFPSFLQSDFQLRQFTTGLAANALDVAGYNIYPVYATQPCLTYPSQSEFSILTKWRRQYMLSN